MPDLFDPPAWAVWLAALALILSTYGGIGWLIFG